MTPSVCIRPLETIYLYLGILILLSLTACEQPQDSDESAEYPDAGCVNCHMDKDLLKEIADPIEAVTSSGEG
ncbi:MAG: hypothetical protein GY868_13455 [Deltaproteobacteria bacterium]|nr:hypothetical protein [Deltaproteobacteria bacterium]